MRVREMRMPTLTLMATAWMMPTRTVMPMPTETVSVMPMRTVMPMPHQQ